MLFYFYPAAVGIASGLAYRDAARALGDEISNIFAPFRYADAAVEIVEKTA